jgi:Uncharacterized conserved protein
MTKTTYHKLVRDLIPEIIAQDGKQCETRELATNEYETLLREKLVEEAQEACEAAPDKLITELADLQEVMLALMRLKLIDPRTLEAERSKRETERGTFKKRLLLLWVEEDPKLQAKQ